MTFYFDGAVSISCLQVSVGHHFFGSRRYVSHSIGLAVASIHTNHDRDKTKTGRGPLEVEGHGICLQNVSKGITAIQWCVHAKNLVRQGATLHPPVTKPLLPDPAFLPIFGLRPLLISV